MLGMGHLAHISVRPLAVPNLATHFLFLSRRIATKFAARFCLTQDRIRRTTRIVSRSVGKAPGGELLTSSRILSMIAGELLGNRCVRAALIACAVLMCSLLGYSQASDVKARPESKSAEHKLSSAQQRGLRLLQSAETDASALQPDMRAFVLWKVAEGYRGIDPVKADALLNRAFLASVDIEDIAPEFGDKC